MYNAFWRYALFVGGKSISVKTFDRSRNSYQVIRLGVGNDFPGGLPGRRSLSPRVSPSRAPVFLEPTTSKRLLHRLTLP